MFTQGTKKLCVRVFNIYAIYDLEKRQVYISPDMPAECRISFSNSRAAIKSYCEDNKLPLFELDPQVSKEEDIFNGL